MDTTSKETLLKSMSSDDIDKIQPCFLFDSDMFKQNVVNYRNGFAFVFGDKFILSYSTKTNPHPLVLKALSQVPGVMIEIVSPHELELAIEAGFTFNRIVYNGVIPDLKGKVLVASHGGIVNVENYRELKEMADYAEKYKLHLNVGLRVNIRIDKNRKWESRFGVKPFTDQFYECLECQNDYLKIVGIHSHIHGCRTLEMWKERARQLGLVCANFGFKYIDFGSNLFGYMDGRLASQFDCDVPTAAEYAKAICDELRFYFRESDFPSIIIEPGTPVVANTVSVLGKVENINDRGFDTIATASCSVYDFGFFHGSDKHPPMDVIHMSKGKHYENLEIFGYACTEDDTVCKSYAGNLAVGDYLLFRNLGAYANSLCSDFIKPKLKTIDIAMLK